VVMCQFLEGNGPCTRITVRSEAKIDMKDAFTPSLDQINDGASHRFEIHVVCSFRSFMDEQQLKIRGIAHLTAPELPETTNRECPRSIVRKVLAANRDTLVEHYFRKIG